MPVTRDPRPKPLAQTRSASTRAPLTARQVSRQTAGASAVTSIYRVLAASLSRCLPTTAGTVATYLDFADEERKRWEEGRGEVTEGLLVQHGPGGAE